MRDSVRLLREMLGPGVPPSGHTPWDSSTVEVGFEFPEDYRALVDTYGSMCINDEGMGHRGVGGGFAEFLANTTAEGEIGPMLTRMRARRAMAAPYPVWPEQGGLVYWGGGRTSTRNSCFWLTEGDDPNRWPVVAWMGMFDWIRFDGGFADFILALVTGSWVHSDRLIYPKSPTVPLFQQLGGWGDAE
jgi:hypothetical protein